MGGGWPLVVRLLALCVRGWTPGSHLGLVISALVSVHPDNSWEPVEGKGGGREGGADVLELLAEAEPLGPA